MELDKIETEEAIKKTTEEREQRYNIRMQLDWSDIRPHRI